MFEGLEGFSHSEAKAHKKFPTHTQIKAQVSEV